MYPTLVYRLDLVSWYQNKNKKEDKVISIVIPLVCFMSHDNLSYNGLYDMLYNDIYDYPSLGYALT